MLKTYDVLVAGGGNAALCAAITAAERGARVLIAEAAPKAFRGGNSRHTRNLRTAHAAPTEVLTGSYPVEEYYDDLMRVVAGKTAVALGKAHDTWLGDNDGLQGEVDEFTSCAGHSNFASVNYKPTPAGKTPEDSLITFSDCNFHKGATFDALGTAMGAWSEYLDENGSEAGIFHWYPIYGGGGEKFDFKWLEVHGNFEEMGRDYEMFGNGRGFEKYGELLDPLVTCDAARVYRAKSRRFVQLR